MAQQGRFVWHDLFTSDVQAASAFYGAVAGWTFQPGGDGAWMIQSGDEQIGRIAPLPQPGIPPHWLGYVEVADVDAAGRRAAELGGRVHLPGTDVSNIGRFALLTDPQGAFFAVYASFQPWEPADTEQPGRFSWGELNTTDWEAAWKFYEGLFGWKRTSSMDLGPDLGTYAMFGLDEKRSVGGMSNIARAMNLPPHWLFYFNVPDIQRAVQAVEAGGGKVVNGPSEIPGGDWIAQCADPQGAHFAVYAHGGP